ncbi:MAG TPA: hypothetical protein VNE62_00225 [Actinomycetota bacterium]|nr:hypothetical protein [Actinomycetota bacterium]
MDTLWQPVARQALSPDVLRCLDGITVPVDCGGRTHHVRWSSGQLSLLDHQLTEERALVAMGGELPPCMQILASWGGDWTDDELMAVLGTPAAGKPPWLRRWGSPFASGRSARQLRAKALGLQESSRDVDSVSSRMERADARMSVISRLPPQLGALLCLSVAYDLGPCRWKSNTFRHTGPDFQGGFYEALNASLREGVQVAGVAEGGREAVCGFVAVGDVPPGALGFAVDGAAVLAAFVHRSWPTRVLHKGRTLMNGSAVLHVESTEGGREIATVVNWVRRGDVTVPVTSRLPI